MTFLMTKPWKKIWKENANTWETILESRCITTWCCMNFRWSSNKYQQWSLYPGTGPPGIYSVWMTLGHDTTFELSPSFPPPHHSASLQYTPRRHRGCPIKLQYNYILMSNGAHTTWVNNTTLITGAQMTRNNTLLIKEICQAINPPKVTILFWQTEKHPINTSSIDCSFYCFNWMYCFLFVYHFLWFKKIILSM